MNGTWKWNNYVTSNLYLHELKQQFILKNVHCIDLMEMLYVCLFFGAFLSPQQKNSDREEIV